jgi:hypothetical protein
MQQFNIATDSALIANIEKAQFKDIHSLKECVIASIQKICDYSEKTALLIEKDIYDQVIDNSKKSLNKDDNIADNAVAPNQQLDVAEIDISQQIDDIYKIRDKYVKQLNFLVEYYKKLFGNNTDFLFSDNKQWDRYTSKIVTLENANMEYLKTKSAESKNKLSKIINNKSLLLYNKKVELNYENRVL